MTSDAITKRLDKIERDGVFRAPKVADDEAWLLSGIRAALAAECTCDTDGCIDEICARCAMVRTLEEGLK